MVRVKQRGYRVRVEEGRVSVERRVSFRLGVVALVLMVYSGYSVLLLLRHASIDLYRAKDAGDWGVALLELLVPVLLGAGWFFSLSGEVMRCDAQELHFARRRILGRWQRFRFSSEQIKELQRAVRPRGRSSYAVMTFQYGGRTFDMLEEISYTDADLVLQACKSMGLDVIISVDPGARMLKDIEQRGWFINPLKPDREGDSSAKK